MAKKRALKILAIVLVFSGSVGGAYLLHFLWKHEMFVPATYDLQAPDIPPMTGEKKILLFSKTNSFRHVDSIPVVNQLISALADKKHWAVYPSENAAVHNALDLASFDLVIWNNVSGDVLTDLQKAAFKTWITTGGKWLGLHGSGGDISYQWSWYPNVLLKAQFIGHPLLPQFRQGSLSLEATTHPTTRGLPNTFSLTDEWYSFAASPRDKTNVLITIDEKSYDVPDVLAMGDDHPLVWTHNVGTGTVFYSAIGHLPEIYADPTYRSLIEKTLQWLLSP